ncbi:efflux RND transporter permease subunit [Marinoscillum sp.]|uniref:efflux RND transporter permease subunit n=1 Tax=Marinoscillum sp. TaxID=2024838 RepID=UPI003BAD7550
MAKKGLLHTIIHRKVLISMLFIGFSMLGYISYKKLPVEIFPNVELPILIVQVGSSNEVDPKYMERQAIIPLESAIGTLEGVEEITANADSRRGMIFITFQPGVNIKYAYLKLEQKVGAIKTDLAPEFMVNIIKIDTEQFTNAFMDLQVLGSGGVDRVRNVADQYITRRLEDLEGIGGVEVFGGRQKTIEIIMNDAVCEANNITPNTIRTVLSQNANKSAFAGQVEQNGQQLFVNVTAELKDIKNIQNLVVSEQGPLLLQDVADVFFGVKEETSLSRVNGKDAVSIRLTKDSQANLIEVSDRTLATIAAINEDLEALDIELLVQSNQAELMTRNINQIKNLAVTGGLLAIFVLWVFLRRLKFIMSIALAIPISVFTAFNFFYATDITINSLTLIGMALAVGMLLDNSVVVIENIYRHVVNKKRTEDAVVDGTKEVMRSVSAATFTTVTVFLPFIFSSNFLVTTIGSHIGISIISTLLVSLVVSLVLVPMLAHTAISKEDRSKAPLIKNASIRQRLIQVYIVFLKSCFRRPAFTVIGGLVLFFVTIGLSLLVSISSLSEVETTDMNLFITPPQGATLDWTDQRTRKVEEKVMEIPVVDKVISQVSEDNAVLTIFLVEGFNDLDTIDVLDVKNRITGLSRDFEDLELSMTAPLRSGGQGGQGGAGPSAGANFERMLGIGTAQERIVIKGQDFELMQTVAEDINKFVGSLESVNFSRVSVSPQRPEAHILFDQSIMSAYNITQQNVAVGLNDFQPAFASGTNFISGDEEYEITIRTQKQQTATAKNMADLRKMTFKSSTGTTHSLDEIGSVIYSTGESTISRTNQEKQIEITYGFIKDVVNSESLLEASRIEIDELVSGVNIPSGMVVEVIHDEGLYDEFYFLIFAAIIVIFMILAAVFESLYLPIVIMFSIPLAGIGAFLGLTLTGNSLLNANTLIGFLILLGVVVNNGIILIDYSRILRRQGYGKHRALIMSSISRIRPILITSITTIVAMLPLALGEAEYVISIGQPFAVTVMGGLAFATILTLIYIPTMSAGLESVLNWFRNLKPTTKFTQIGLMVLVTVFISLEIEGFLWQSIWFLAALILIPGGTHFVLTSLRQANANMVAPGEKMHIVIQNLTKVYGRDKRWIREWKGNKHLYEERGEAPLTKRMVFQNLIWQLALLSFLVFFVYTYLDKAFWQLVFMIGLHLLVLTIYEDITSLFTKGKRLVKIFNRLIFWLFPLFSSIYLYADIQTKGLGILLILLWFTGLYLTQMKRKFAKNPLDVSTIKGRFAKIRRFYFRLLLAMPYVRPKKPPFKALKGVSLTIEQGMFGLLGPNGAGKTTLMRILCGIMDQSYGKIWINGHDTNLRREELQGLIGYLPQAFGTYENMSPYQFLDYQAILRKITNKTEREERVQYVLKAVHMDEHQHKKIGSFSGGMKQRIGIAQILLHLPKILVVDEPTAGLDPLERIRFRNLLVELSRERIVVFSTHIIEDIASSCNNLAVLISGNIQYMGSPTAMAELAHDKVWEFHLNPETFEQEKEHYLIVHHMREGDLIRVKCLSDTQPREDAVSVRANLEDAYLWLMKNQNRNQ